MGSVCREKSTTVNTRHEFAETWKGLAIESTCKAPCLIVPPFFLARRWETSHLNPPSSSFQAPSGGISNVTSSALKPRVRTAPYAMPAAIHTDPRISAGWLR